MATIRPDFSFVREGRPLGAWLLDVVSDDPAIRDKAGDVLHGMSFGLPYAHTNLAELDLEEHGSRPGHRQDFDEAVREAAAAPGFPTADFVRRLIVADMARRHDWRRFRKKSRERAAEERDKVADEIVRRLTDAGEDGDRDDENRRIAVAMCPSLDNRDDLARIDHAIFGQIVVDRALDIAFLTDPIGLRAWLDMKALARIGPPAIEFAPLLLDRLDDEGGSSVAAALGSIGRDDPAVVAALLGRLRSGTEVMQRRVAECLFHAGPALAGRVDEAVAILIDQSRREGGPSYWATEALGSVGRDREDALERLLQLAMPRPPRWFADPYSSDGRADAVMGDRGMALTALRFFPKFADRIVPVLIEAIDSFEEYDPDYTYHGEYDRVCLTLRVFGPEGAAAVPRLVVYLDGFLLQYRENTKESTDDRPNREVVTDYTYDWPKSVFDAIAAIGPAASAALAVLEALRRARWIDDGDEAPPPFDRIDELDRAILAIRGEIARPTFA